MTTITLTDEQQRLVDLATAPDAPGLVCLTGGPGTGKTTTLRALLDRAQALGLRVACAAPSGKAALRMEEATGRPAATLHRLLRLRPGDDVAVLRDQLAAPELHRNLDLLVVDESSMVDVSLMAVLTRAARQAEARVLLVGDADQLPPVGPGRPYADLLESGLCPTVRLTQVHRQAAESGIVRAAHAILGGQLPEWNDTDFRFVACDELAGVPAAVWDVVQREQLDAETSQVLCPQNAVGGSDKGGVRELNAFVEATRRPLELGEVVTGKGIRAGSKVIVTKNDYELEVFNGEIGFVLDVQQGGKGTHRVTVGLADGREVVFAGMASKKLALAWAVTVHRSQGSQWDDVVVVAHKAHTHMLSRSLLYVAVTRAARRVWVVGQREAVARAAKNSKGTKRDTWLGARFARARAAREAAGKAAAVAARWA